MVKTVYYYNWRDIVVITRDSYGTWYHTYTPSKVVEYINRKVKEKNLNSQSKGDIFDAGLMFGYKLNTIFEECQISYGDKPFKVKTNELWNL